MRKGFTLLELIVVVIIIGILGSIGYSQYNVAVEKAKISEAIQVAGYIRTAQQAYYLEYGRYAVNITNLIDVNAQSAALKYFNKTKVEWVSFSGHAIGTIAIQRNSDSIFKGYTLYIPFDYSGDITCLNDPHSTADYCAQLGYGYNNGITLPP